jgi:hypothetical protein
MVPLPRQLTARHRTGHRRSSIDPRSAIALALVLTFLRAARGPLATDAGAQPNQLTSRRGGCQARGDARFGLSPDWRLLAGMLPAETVRQLKPDRPLFWRDVLIGMLFITIGTLLNLCCCSARVARCCSRSRGRAKMINRGRVARFRN